MRLKLMFYSGPDLNPVENIWDQIGRAIRRRRIAMKCTLRHSFSKPYRMIHNDDNKYGIFVILLQCGLLSVEDTDVTHYSFSPAATINHLTFPTATQPNGRCAPNLLAELTTSTLHRKCLSVHAQSAQCCRVSTS
ncbi:hypothetical protein J6590_031233 [Homalodisca vitripennis]|nr:hypothetical protein J6590_031233 [Homalodisca vitripennis]